MAMVMAVLSLAIFGPLGLVTISSRRPAPATAGLSVVAAFAVYAW